MSEHDDAMTPSQEQAGAAGAPVEPESEARTASSHASFGAGSMLSDMSEMAAYDGIEMPPSYPPGLSGAEGFAQFDETMDEVSAGESEDLAEDARADGPVAPVVLASPRAVDEFDGHGPAEEPGLAEEAEAAQAPEACEEAGAGERAADGRNAGDEASKPADAGYTQPPAGAAVPADNATWEWTLEDIDAEGGPDAPAMPAQQAVQLSDPNVWLFADGIQTYQGSIVPGVGGVHSASFPASAAAAMPGASAMPVAQAGEASQVLPGAAAAPYTGAMPAVPYDSAAPVAPSMEAASGMPAVTATSTGPVVPAPGGFAATAADPFTVSQPIPVVGTPATITATGMPAAVTGPIPVQAGEAGTPAVRYHAPRWKAPARHSVTFYFAIAVLLSVGIGGLMLMRPFLMTHGVGTTIMLAMLAFLPVIVIVTFITWIDNWEPEPMVLYVVAFMWGAGVSTIFSLIFNNMFGTATSALMSPKGSDVVSVVVGAPLIEEAFKGVGVLVLLFFFAKNFNGPVDGIVYGMLIGLGFAFTENILYFGQYYDSLATVFRARAILNPFVHPLATAMTGLFVGLSIQQKSRTSLFYLMPTGYAIAVGLHALHNLSAVLNVSETTRMFYQIPIYLLTTAIIMAARVAERREVMTALNEYAKAGWLTTNELSMIQTLPNRRQAVFWARNAVEKAGGDPEDGAEAMKRFQDELIQLGYARSRALHHGDVNRARNRKEEAERLELLGQLRKVFTGKHAAGIA